MQNSRSVPPFETRIWYDLISNAAVGVYRVTLKGRFLWVNRKMAEIFGFESEKAFLASVSNGSQLWANREEKNLFLTQMTTAGFVTPIEARAKRSDGKIIWISIIARTLHDEIGERVNEGFVVDITDRKRAETALSESENRFRTLVEQAGDGFFVTDYSGQFFDVNEQACRSLGYSRQELLQMNVADIDIELSRSRHKERFWKPLAPGKFITFDGIHKRKDGSTFPVEIRLSRVDLSDKALLLALIRDVTDRKEAENQLRNAFEEINLLKNQLEQENTFLREEIAIRYRPDEIVGKSIAIRKVLAVTEKVANKDTCVLILGETGTGKELLARAIHNMSARKNRAMIKVNCAALPATLIEGELFGREKGAFTGATSMQIGRFEAAHESTLFLDEVGELPLDLQAKLLHVLQDHSFERLGSSKTICVDVRLIAATNQNLAEEVNAKRFRRDLFYRLNVFPITIPPLRERREDVPMLVWAFVNEFSKSMGKPIKSIQNKTMEYLKAQDWPGNVRQLRNVVERAMILSAGETLTFERLGAQETASLEIGSLDDMIRDHITHVLKKTRWRVSGSKGAAQILGLNESTLRSKIKKLNIFR